MMLMIIVVMRLSSCLKRKRKYSKHYNKERQGMENSTNNLLLFVWLAVGECLIYWVRSTNGYGTINISLSTLFFYGLLYWMIWSNVGLNPHFLFPTTSFLYVLPTRITRIFYLYFIISKHSKNYNFHFIFFIGKYFWLFFF